MGEEGDKAAAAIGTVAAAQDILEPAIDPSFEGAEAVDPIC